MINEKNLEKSINRLKNEKNLSEEFIVFYEEILIALLKKQKSIQISDQEKEKILLNVKAKFESNVPVLDINTIEVSDVYLNELFMNFIDIMIKHNKEQNTELKKLKDYAKKDGNVEFKKLMNSLIAGKENDILKISDELNVNSGWLVYILNLLCKAVFTKYAEFIQPEITDKYEFTGECPACGNIAGMARLKEETGERVLWCGICDSEWPYKRMKCVFCGNEDHTKLSNFSIEDNSPFRVDVCEMCSKYIKTIDERRLKEGTSVTMSFEEIATVDLDVAAEEEGYIN